MVKRSFVAFMAVALFGWIAVSTSIAQTPTPVTNPAKPAATADKAETLPSKDSPKQEEASAGEETKDAPAEQKAEATAKPKRTTADLLPVSTKAWLSIPNADDLDKRFTSTQLGQLAKNEKLKPFAEHVETQLKDWINKQNVRLNLDIDDLHGVYSGEICFAGILPEDDAGEPIPGKHGLVFLMDVSDTKQQAIDLQKKINAELVKRGATQSNLKLNGIDYVKSVIDKPKVFRKKRFNFQAITNGWMIVSNNESVFREVISRVSQTDAKANQDSLSAHPTFKIVMSNTGLGDHSPQITWFLNPFGYIQLAQQIKDDEARSRIPRDDVAKKLKDNGFDAFKGMGGNIAVATDEHEILHRTFTYAKRKNVEANKRVFDLFNFQVDQELSVPAWVPNDASSIVMGNWDFDSALSGVGFFYDIVIARQKGEFERMLSDFKVDPNLQLDVRKLVSMLGDRITIVGATEKPIDLDSERVVAGIPIKGDADYVFNSIKRAQTDAKMIVVGGVNMIEIDSTVEEPEDQELDIPGFGVEPEEDDEEDERQPRFQLFEKRYIAIGNNEILVSNNKNYLRKILARKESQLEAASDYQQVAEALAKLTDAEKICWRHFGRLDASLETNYEMLRRGQMADAQNVLARLMNEIAKKQAADDALAQGRQPDPDVVRKQVLDGGKLPADYKTAIAPYLGPQGSVMEVEADGWRITGCFLKKKPVEEVVRNIEDGDKPNRK